MEGFFSVLAFCPHVNGIFGRQKRKVFEGARLPLVESVVWTDGKTEVLKYDVIHHTCLVRDAIVFPSLNRFRVDEQK